MATLKQQFTNFYNKLKSKKLDPLKERVDNLETSTAISEAEGNTLEQKEDGLYVAGVNISEEENNNLEQKEDGLYSELEITTDKDRESGFKSKYEKSEFTEIRFLGTSLYKNVLSKNTDTTWKVFDIPEEYDVVRYATKGKYRGLTNTELKTLFSDSHMTSFNYDIEEKTLTVNFGDSVFHAEGLDVTDTQLKIGAQRSLVGMYYSSNYTFNAWPVGMTFSSGNHSYYNEAGMTGKGGSSYAMVACDKTGEYTTNPPEGFLDVGMDFWLCNDFLRDMVGNIILVGVGCIDYIDFINPLNGTIRHKDEEKIYTDKDISIIKKAIYNENIIQADSSSFASLPVYKYLKQNGSETATEIPKDYDIAYQLSDGKFRTMSYTEAQSFINNISSVNTVGDFYNLKFTNGQELNLLGGTYHYKSWCAYLYIATSTYTVSSSKPYPYYIYISSVGKNIAQYVYSYNDTVSYLPVCDKTGDYAVNPPEGFTDVGIPGIWVSKSLIPSANGKTSLATIYGDTSNLETKNDQVIINTDDGTINLASMSDVESLATATRESVATVADSVTSAKSTATSANTTATNATTRLNYIDKLIDGDPVCYTPKNSTVSIANKSSYNNYNYKYYIGNLYVKYNTYDKLTKMDAVDDITTYVLGKDFRLPTWSDFQNLMTNANIYNTESNNWVQITAKDSISTIYAPKSTGYYSNSTKYNTTSSYFLTSEKTSPSSIPSCYLANLTSTATSFTKTSNYAYYGYVAFAVSETAQPNTAKIGDLYWTIYPIGASKAGDTGYYFSWGDTSNVTSSRVSSADTVNIYCNVDGKTRELALKDDLKSIDISAVDGNTIIRKIDGLCSLKEAEVKEASEMSFPTYLGKNEDSDYYDSNSETFTKYGAVDSVLIQEPEDDPITKALGPAWRMPNYVDWSALTKYGTTGSTITQDENYIIFTSKVTGSVLHVPKRKGYWYNGTLYSSSSYYYIFGELFSATNGDVRALTISSSLSDVSFGTIKRSSAAATLAVSDTEQEGSVHFKTNSYDSTTKTYIVKDIYFLDNFALKTADGGDGFVKFATTTGVTSASEGGAFIYDSDRTAHKVALSSEIIEQETIDFDEILGE